MSPEPTPNLNPEPTYDIAIAGAGLIGLTLALELHARGASVAVVDTVCAMRQTSIAAAGMLAASDPHNPPALQALATYSLSLYPAFLNRIAAHSGLPIPIQTTSTIQHLDSRRTLRLAEDSIDPRQLGPAVLEAAKQLNIALHENAEHIEVDEQANAVHLRPLHGPAIVAKQLVHATGAWFHGPPSVIKPRKGQMLRVRIPSDFSLHEVHRSSTIYIVPRTQGPQSGTALLGATDEDAGFNLQTHQPDLDRLRALAAALIPVFASAREAPQVEAWAGLRPAAPDNLPLLGPMPNSSRQWIATGHYRNGILLAPATASIFADLLESKPPAIDLKPFAPTRF